MHRTQHASSARFAACGLFLALSAACVLALPARADVTVQEKTVSSGLAGFGAGTTTVTRVIAGDKARDDETFTYTGRLKTFAGKPRSTSTITRLDKELIWSLDNAKKTYDEMTFAQLREAVAKGAAEANAQQEKAEHAKAKDDVQFDYKVDVQRTGKKDKVNGFDAEEWIIKLTAEPKDKKTNESAGSFTIKLDGWYSTQVPGQAEVTAYYRRWAEKMGMDPQLRTMASGLLAAHGDAVKEIAAKMKELKGVAVRSTMTMDMAADLTPEQQAKMDQAKADQAKAQADAAKERKKADAREDVESGTEAATSASKGNLKGALGGFLGRKLAKAAEHKAEASATSAAGSGSGTGTAFSVTTDMLSVSTGSAGASFDVPAGYKKTERKQ